MLPWMGDNGTMRVFLSRWVCLDVETNCRRIKEEVCRAAMDGAAIAVLPELCLTGYRREVDPVVAREVFAAASRSFPEVLCVFGTISEGGRNRLTAWLGGEEVVAYDKVHLFFPNKEEEMWTPGDRFVVLDWNGFRIGFLVCNDLRYPEQARALALEGRCDLLIVPGWWPWRRDHIWRTLLQARAIENALWVAGCCIAGSVYSGEDFSGAGNYVFDPLGEPVRTVDDHNYRLEIDHRPSLVVDPREHPPISGSVEICEVGADE
jgi:predicted amidohydrolase